MLKWIDVDMGESVSIWIVKIVTTAAIVIKFFLAQSVQRLLWL